MGRHHDRAWTAYVDRAKAGWPSSSELIRARTGEGRERAKARGVKMGRKPKLTPRQMREAVRRRDKGEPMQEIARTFRLAQHDFTA